MTLTAGCDRHIAQQEEFLAKLRACKRKRDGGGEGGKRGRGKGPQWTRNEEWWELFNAGAWGGIPVLTGGGGGWHDDGQEKYWDPNQASGANTGGSGTSGGGGGGGW